MWRTTIDRAFGERDSVLVTHMNGVVVSLSDALVV